MEKLELGNLATSSIISLLLLQPVSKIFAEVPPYSGACWVLVSSAGLGCARHSLYGYCTGVQQKEEYNISCR